MHAPPIVYLDTQDFSRFGDVLRGKSNTSTEAIFVDLERRKLAGEVVFAASMPLLGELLQYDVDFRETTIKKAEAMERLCGSWALADPARVLAAEIAELAKQRGLLPVSQNTAVLSQDRYWFPNLASELVDLRERLEGVVDTLISQASLDSRLNRRQAKRVRKMDLSRIVQLVAPELAASLDIPVESVMGSIVALLSNKITPEQASRRLFGAIAEPVKFVETYFEKIKHDCTLLPRWMSKMGSDFEALLGELRDTIQPFTLDESDRKLVESMIAERIQITGRAVLGMVSDETDEFGIDAGALRVLKGCEVFADQLPACEVFGRVVTAYVLQIAGLRGSAGKIERSFGGDMVHALYLPHVDLWRGDRRFAQLVKEAAPRFGDRVISTINELPHAIDTWRELR